MQPTSFEAPASSQEPTSFQSIDQQLARLQRGVTFLKILTIPRRIELIQKCIAGVDSVAREWVEVACAAKRIPADSHARAEEVTTGPLSTQRFLQLLVHTLRDIQRVGKPILPGAVTEVDGQQRVDVFPTPLLFDRLFFRPMMAETWLQRDVDPENLFAESLRRLQSGGDHQDLVVVLGAGNVSSIAATDALTKILIENQVVALKMNPVNECLGPIFEKAFQPLVENDLLQLSYGGIDTGKYLVEHDLTTAVHITGSTNSHDAIVWGNDDQQSQRRADGAPILQKEITSELGNVSPWAIVPCKYSDRELNAQAETIAASIVNNVSFNCIATKVILTCRDWPQRERFMGKVQALLEKHPRRYAYYPGAADRHERFSEMPVDDPEFLPWTLLRDVDIKERPLLVQEESFTCVCSELVLDADSELSFLNQAVEIMNDQIWGTLAATITSTPAFQRQYPTEFDRCLQQLRFGTIGINQWPALGFAWMSPPWGGHPSTSLENAVSGIGFVHNTYLLDRPEKTVIRAPLALRPKPIWYSNHRHPERVAWDMTKLYARPSLLKLPGICLSAFTG